MRVFPHLPPVASIFPTLGSPDSPHSHRRRVFVLTARRAAAVFLLLLGGANAVFAVTTQTYSSLIPAIALTVWGVAAWRPPRPATATTLDALCIAVCVPLFPYYLNLGAAALWGQDWWDLALTTRLLPLAAGAGFAALLCSLAIRLRFNEARQIRRRFLSDYLYEVLDKRQARASFEAQLSDLLERWLKVKLPLERCRALIIANVPPEAAHAEEVARLTEENLLAMGWMAQSGSGVLNNEC